MNRDVLLIYLRDLRDLEVAKYQLNIMKRMERDKNNQEVNTIQAEIKSKTSRRTFDEPASGGDLMGWAGVLGGLAACGVGAWVMIEIFIGWWLPALAAPIKGLIIPLTIICAIGAGILFLIEMAAHSSRMAALRQFNEKEDRRIRALQPEIKKLQEKINSKNTALELRIQFLDSEYDKVFRLLTKAYSANILATPYRNLQSVYYIYDVMSTSQSTLEEAIFYERMENGIQRIEAKLDTIIAQNEEIIFHTRMIEANTSEIKANTVRILETNQRMLESQQRTEANTLEAAQNAQVAANYAETNAFFSAAEYFDNLSRR